MQDASQAAEIAEPPIESRIAQGLYRPDCSAAQPQGTGLQYACFRPSVGVSLLGGYAGLTGTDPNARDIHLYETVLSGDLLGNDAPVSDPNMLQGDSTRDENSWNIVAVRGGPTQLDGCTVAGGTEVGLYVYRTVDVTVSNCTFRGNRNFNSLSPAAVDVGTKEGGQVVLRQCLFINNAGLKGVLGGERVLVDECQFIRNHGHGFGTSAANLWRSTVTNSVFSENSSWPGGGVLVFGRLTLVKNCLFERNRCTALVCHLGASNVSECIFVCSESTSATGILASGDLSLENCPFVGNRNTADKSGGALTVHESGSLEVNNCVFLGNRAAEGRFLAVEEDRYGRDTVRVVVRNSVISNGGDEVWSDGSPVEISYCCIPGGMASISEPNDWLTWGPGNLDADPCFADPGYWDANGTLEDVSDDFFVRGDYHLKTQAGCWDSLVGDWVTDEVTSPCIDAGDPNSPIGLEPFPNGGYVNIGAYGGTAEASKSYFGEPPCETITAGDINGDCRVDLTDLLILISHWTDGVPPNVEDLDTTGW